MTAGFGEELLYGGAIQPRLGLWLPSLRFALSHQQYELSPTFFTVLGAGLALGVVRQRTNTTTAILAHTGHNTLGTILALLS